MPMCSYTYIHTQPFHYNQLQENQTTTKRFTLNITQTPRLFIVSPTAQRTAAERSRPYTLANHSLSEKKQKIHIPSPDCVHASNTITHTCLRGAHVI